MLRAKGEGYKEARVGVKRDGISDWELSGYQEVRLGLGLEAMAELE